MNLPRGPAGHLALLGAALLLAALIAIHLLALRFAVSRLALPTAAVLGIVALVALQHLGLFGSIAAWLRRRMRRDREGA